MKVISLNIANAISNKGLEKKSIKKQAENTTSKPIINNTLSEAMGRSQISFKGDITSDCNKIHYTPKKNLLSSGSEQIEYDKATHSLSYTETYANGTIKKIFIYSPLNNTEITEEYEKDGSGFEERISNDEQTRHEFGPKKQILASKKTFADGTFETYNYEHQNGRIVFRHFNQMSELDNVKVYDINTKSPLTPDNPKAITSIETTTPDGLTHYKKYNLLTNYVYEEQTRDGKRLIEGYRKNYNNIITWQAQTDEKGALHECLYDNQGKIIKNIIQDFANMRRFEKTFDNDRCLESNLLFEYDSKNKNFEKITYFNVTMGHPYKIITKNGNEELVEELDDKGFPIHEKRTKKNVVQNETFYYANSPRPHYVILNIANQRNSDFEYEKTVYHPNGQVKRIELSNNGYVEQIDFYSPDSTYVNRTRVINPHTGEYNDYIQDRNKIVTQKMSYDPNNMLYYEAKYYYNTNVPSHETHYSPDGAIKKIKYSSNNIIEKIEYISSDRKMRIIDEYFPNSTKVREKHTYDYARKTHGWVRYDEYGNVTFNHEEEIETPNNKNQRQEQNRQYQGYYNQYTYNTNSTNRQKTNNSIEDVISELSSKIFKNNFSTLDISLDDWETFAKFIGLNSGKELLEMNKKTYRETMKKIHPDLKKEDEKKLYEEVSKIVNKLYENINK